MTWPVVGPLFCNVILGLLWTGLCDDLFRSMLLVTWDAARTEHPLVHTPAAEAALPSVTGTLLVP